ncbi:long-chain-fatty-acid-CoA-ligase [Vararia minispora EC-137]|uniref:Long-chain-fatty-acid-CoA-ligase n=1 Tax=Vararia minispora EC-137 TaxID=1314806 RepID=A0ACB8QKF8_9AGAM|nr:long-chain-fatty-acid-CoA-ligase [Vararia minispora EC-137]
MTSTLKPGENWGKGSVEVVPPQAAGESGIRRLAKTAAKLVTQPLESIKTVPDVLNYAERTHGDRRAYGYRDVVQMVEEEKEVKKMVGGKEVSEMKKWRYFQLSDYKFISFIDLKKAVVEVAGGLLELGLQKGEVVNIYAQTSPQWQFMSQACTWVSATIATAYDTLGEEGLQHSLNEPECVGVFTNAELLPVVAKVSANVPSLRFVIYDGEGKPEVIDKLVMSHEGIRVLHLDELRALGRSKSIEEVNGRMPSPEDVACIMYTSGTTGAPKGVVIKHSNLIAAIGAIYTLFGHEINSNDVFLAFLPLAHILEYIVELCFVFIGMTQGYGRVKTLTDTSVRNCVGDIKALRPTIMVAVPAVWELIRKGIMAQINAGSSLTKSVFHGAMTIKKNQVPVMKNVVDSVVFNKIRQATGGRLRLALSGGAALSKETQEFLSLALVTLLQGYGMTESCGMCAILPPECMQYSSVGLPSPAVEIKLLDVPEAGYSARGKPPQGEVCIRGPAVISGYYKRDDLNSDPTIFPGDGWLRTGDVGQWNEDGTLSLIDRIKNLVKLQGGEYIALERLESTYKSSYFVGNICVYATPDAKQPIAIVVPHEGHLRAGLKSVDGVDASADLHKLCVDKRVKDAVLKDLNAAGKKAGFKGMEMLEAVILTPEEWTPESGLVTAAQKIQRKKIAEKFAAEIKEAYKN